MYYREIDAIKDLLGCGAENQNCIVSAVAVLLGARPIDAVAWFNFRSLIICGFVARPTAGEFSNPLLLDTKASQALPKSAVIGQYIAGNPGLACRGIIGVFRFIYFL